MGNTAINSIENTKKNASVNLKLRKVLVLV